MLDLRNALQFTKSNSLKKVKPMTAQVLELEGTWEEILAQAANFAGRRVRIIVLANEDEEALPSPEESLRQAWLEIKTGKTRPVSELWDGIDAE